MEHYRRHKTYTPPQKTDRISDTVELPPLKTIMPNMSYTDAAIRAAHDLIHALHNCEPTSLLVKFGDSHKSSIRELSGIFDNDNPRARTLRVVPPEIKLHNLPNMEHYPNTKKTRP